MDCKIVNQSPFSLHPHISREIDDESHCQQGEYTFILLFSTPLTWAKSGHENGYSLHICWFGVHHTWLKRHWSIQALRKSLPWTRYYAVLITFLPYFTRIKCPSICLQYVTSDVWLYSWDMESDSSWRVWYLQHWVTFLQTNIVNLKLHYCDSVHDIWQETL